MTFWGGKIFSIFFYLCVHLLVYVCILKWDLTMLTRKSQRPPALGVPRAEIKGVCFHAPFFSMCSSDQWRTL